MRGILVTTMMALIATYANVAAQEWQATALGPGSQPGTVLVEISGFVGDTGECGPDPAQNACSVYFHFLHATISPCADTPNVACGVMGYDGDTGAFASPGEEFTVQFEIEEGVTYFIDGWYEFGAEMDGSHDGTSCEPASWCAFIYDMNPTPLVISAAVPVVGSGWSVLKSTYGDR